MVAGALPLSSAMHRAARRSFPLLLTATAMAQGPAWSSPDAFPTARWSHAMAYDAGRARTVLFGGADGTATGRSDTWELDARGWSRANPATVPPGRVAHGMAYDPRRGVVVLFGGFTHQQVNANALDDTWEWDGRNWRLVPGSGMVARGGHTMCWSGIDQQILMFGGRIGCSGFCAQDTATYSFNGTSWSLRSFAGPGARENCGMAWVPSVQRVVLVGGQTGTPAATPVQDAWAWNGSSWSVMSNSGTLPGTTHVASLTWDGARSRLVLIGGNGSPFGQEFTWFGNVVNSATVQWSVQSNRDPLTQALIPEPSDRAAVVFDEARQRSVVFGGRSLVDQAFSNKLHELPPTGAWTPRNPPATRPSSRIYTEAAYDRGNRRLVLAGGWDGAPISDTWTFDGTTWVSHHTAHYLPARRHQAMFAIEPTGQVVMFGGGIGGTGLNTVFADMWAWIGSTWITVGGGSPTPPGRSGHDIVWDTARARAVMFGGWNGVANLQDTWEWQPSNPNFSGIWTPIGSAVSPPARNSHKLAYDQKNQRTVLFGGSDQNGQFLGDTWSYTAAGWTQLAPATSPPRRWNHVMDYDPARQVVVLMGGYGNPQCGNFCASHLADVWEFDAATWRPRTGANALFGEPVTGNGPAGREGMAFVYDTARSAFVLFGGGPGATTFHSDETWQLHSVADRYAAGQLTGGFAVRCAKAPVAGRDVAVTFPSPSGFAWVAVHLQVSPLRTHFADPPVICGSQASFYGLQPIVGQVGGNPGVLQFGLPAWTLGMGLGIQAITLDAAGSCLRVSDPLALTVQAP